MSRRGMFKVLEIKADHVVVTGGISWDAPGQLPLCKGRFGARATR